MKKLLYNRAEIREALYELKREMRNRMNAHIVAFGMRHPKSREQQGATRACGECHCCMEMDGEMTGIDVAIRHFGGRKVW